MTHKEILLSGKDRSGGGQRRRTEEVEHCVFRAKVDLLENLNFRRTLNLIRSQMEWRAKIVGKEKFSLMAFIIIMIRKIF